MKIFSCICTNTIFFENSLCLQCGRVLGYLPDHGVMSTLDPEDALWRALTPDTGGRYRMCVNRSAEDVCNWMVPETDAHDACRSCRLNHIIPNLTTPGNRMLWYRIEGAKRRLLYSLDTMRLPIVGREADPEHGLAFEFLESQEEGGEFRDSVGASGEVMIGHHKGLITINLAEADPVLRERMRERMREAYRTLLGHFRHEIGHYYWDRLVSNTAWHEPFRELFGDETTDYPSALKRHYQVGVPEGWHENHISAYASAHPWEDWAETWAHYMHMVDTLETAHAYAFIENDLPSIPNTLERANFDVLAAKWHHLTQGMNALNRSMGLPDAYPFVMHGRAEQKVRFVHQVVSAQQRTTSDPPA
ncbi:MAG: putative zinc-binding metallopeptidase [Leptospirillia bacterium]